MSSPEKQPEEQRPPTLWESSLSVLAAFFGVQNSKNRERDFTRGKPVHFIVLGIVFTALFIGTVIIAVKFALAKAGV